MKKGVLFLGILLFMGGSLIAQETAMAEVKTSFSPKTTESALFVAGKDILFEDDQNMTEIGMHPNNWDIIEGEAIISEDEEGSKYIMLQPSTIISPKLSDRFPYLPKNFTVEFDFYIDKNRIEGDRYKVCLREDQFSSLCDIIIENGYEDDILYKWMWVTPHGEEKKSSKTGVLNTNKWHKLCLSAKNESVKVYINGEVIIDIPAVASANTLWIDVDCSAITYKNFIKGMKIAQQSSL